MSHRDRIREQRENLPTFEYKHDLIEAIREYSILVIIGETGKILEPKYIIIIRSYKKNRFW